MRFGDLDPGPAPQIPLRAYVRRRQRLAETLGHGHVAIVATETPKRFSHDVEYPFRPHSDFWYLTGFGEPGAVLVLEGGSGTSTLFCRERNAQQEVWTGRRLGPERAADALSVERAYAVSQFKARLPRLMRGARKVHAITAHQPDADRIVRAAAGRRLVPMPKPPRPGGPKATDAAMRRLGPLHASTLIHEMRLVKESAEIEMLQRACDLGVAAHRAAARRVQPGAYEFHVEAAFACHARHHGSNGVGYPSICSGGENAAVLHYVTNLARLERRRPFLIDAGCEWGHYTSDITRTYPVGSWTRVQRRLYDLVERAHHEALALVRPGNTFRQPHERAVEVLSEGLVELGYLKGPTSRVVRTETYRRFFMHGTSHWLGLDVHDAGSPRNPDGSWRTLRPGMVITIEPGLYFNRDYAKCPPEAAGIGIRIEDDVLVTSSGHRVLSRGLPTDADDVAALVRHKA